MQLRGGDLNLSGPGGLAVVTGAQKLVQDLRNWILEPEGTDPLHPNYGSILDGGTLPDGTQVPTIIGTTITDQALMYIQTELYRVCAAYQQQQLTRLQLEAIALNGKNTFAPGEILSSVDDVTVQQYGDTAVANVTVRTSNGTSISIAQPVT